MPWPSRHWLAFRHGQSWKMLWTPRGDGGIALVMMFKHADIAAAYVPAPSLRRRSRRRA